MTTANSLARPPDLLTFAPMIDSEACRFLLAHYGVTYHEQAHIFGWASLIALWHGWTLRIPLLYGDRYRLAGPQQIVDHWDKLCPTAHKLIPSVRNLSNQVAVDWNHFNGTFGTAVAVFAYYHLLPHREIMLEPFSRGAPSHEKAFLKSGGYPFLASLFKLLLGLNAQRAEESLSIVRSTFDETDQRLKDGRRYLAGNDFMLSDIALAASAAPLLLPQGFTAPLPTFDQMPPEMTSVIRELREHETGQFVSRIYREHRNGLSGATAD